MWEIFIIHQNYGTLTKLALLLNEGADEEKIELIEGCIIESIEEAIEEELFFSLPMNEIIKII